MEKFFIAIFIYTRSFLPETVQKELLIIKLSLKQIDIDCLAKVAFEEILNIYDPQHFINLSKMNFFLCCISLSVIQTQCTACLGECWLKKIPN